MEAFFSIVKGGTGFDAVVLAGLNLLDARDGEFPVERLDRVRALSAKVGAATAIHFELASIANDELTKDVAWTLLPYIDSLGLNEMELAALYAALGGDAVPRARLEMSNPEPADVFEAISYVFSKYAPEKRALSRVHFHSLGYHVIAIRTAMKSDKSSKMLREWANNGAAVAAGSVAATLSGCSSTVEDLHGDDLELKRMSFMMDGGEVQKVSESDPVVVYSANRTSGGDSVKFFLAPVCICKAPKGTVGLGDIISATGLAHQL